jgi:hypothetical protein
MTKKELREYFIRGLSWMDSHKKKENEKKAWVIFKPYSPEQMDPS